jgi:DNA-binding MarR family transcriptional regulator
MRAPSFRDSPLRESISYRLGKLFRMMAREQNRAVKPFGLSSMQGQILVTLWGQGAMTIGDLQAAQALGSSTATGALDRMERASLLRRVPVPGDRRASRLEPAAWPERRKQALLDASLDADRRCFAALTVAERRELARLLEKAASALQATDGADDDD